MRTLALLLLLANLVAATWHLGWLPWLPWQPSHFIATRDLSIAMMTVSGEQKPTSSIQETTSVQETDTTDTSDEGDEGDEGEEVPPKDSMPPFATEDMAEDDDKNQTATTPASDAENHQPSTTLPIPANLTKNPETIVPTKDNSEETKLINVANSATTASAKSPTVPLQKTTDAATQTAKSEEKTNKAVTLTTPTSTQENRLASSVCFQTGPFSQEKTANKMAQWFRGKKTITVKIQPQQSQEVESTWVYLPPFKDREAAKTAQQRLQKVGIKDHQIITKGEFNNAISLGRFNNASYAQERVNQLKSKGYQNVKMQPRYKTDTKYWLNVKMPDEQNTVKAFKKNFKDVNLITIGCESLPM
jgi:cell division septation protein DedD